MGGLLVILHLGGCGSCRYLWQESGRKKIARRETHGSGSIQETMDRLEEKMLFIRAVEDRLQELCLSGDLKADLHFSRGQEAIPVGVCAALRDTDYVVTHHRTIAHAIAKGVPMEALLDELQGKPTGLNGGLAGEMHLSDPEHRFFVPSQLVGTCLPIAAGMAWAVKNYKKTDDIVVVFHGDAATANGQWHEGLNLAAVNKVPLLVVCENNHLAGNVRENSYNPVGVSDRARSYGVWSYTVDGNDVMEVRAHARSAVDYVRNLSQPLFLNCQTNRLGRHKQGQGDLRSEEELAELAEQDPLKGMELPSVADLLPRTAA